MRRKELAGLFSPLNRAFATGVALARKRSERRWLPKWSGRRFLPVLIPHATQHWQEDSAGRLGIVGF